MTDFLVSPSVSLVNGRPAVTKNVFTGYSIS